MVDDDVVYGMDKPAGSLDFGEDVLGDIAIKFRRLSADIGRSFMNTFSLLEKTKIKKNCILYSMLSEQDEMDFQDELVRVNRNVGDARAKFDSYIRFTNSVPDFDKFLNKIYHIQKFIESYQNQPGYGAHASDGIYFYPYLLLKNSLSELQLLFSRLEGSLNVAGDYIEAPPPASRSGDGGGGEEAAEASRGTGTYSGGDHHSHPWNPYYERSGRGYYPGDREMRRRQSSRDFGDSEDRL